MRVLCASEDLGSKRLRCLVVSNVTMKTTWWTTCGLKTGAREKLCLPGNGRNIGCKNVIWFFKDK